MLAAVRPKKIFQLSDLRRVNPDSTPLQLCRLLKLYSEYNITKERLTLKEIINSEGQGTFKEYGIIIKTELGMKLDSVLNLYGPGKEFPRMPDSKRKILKKALGDRQLELLDRFLPTDMQISA